MRHKGVTKEETRARMLEAAGRGFRENGFAGIGVDGLAKGADVTSGAFYTHFGSKAAAFDAVLVAGLDEVIAAVPEYQRQHGQDWLKQFAEYYLGREHLENVGGGCAMAALTTDTSRAAENVRGHYEQKMVEIAALIASGLGDTPGTDRLSRAWAVLGTLIGGVNVARTMRSDGLTSEIARAVIASVIATAGPTLAVP